MRCLRAFFVLLLLLPCAAAAAAAPAAGSAIPADASWALVAPAAGPGARAAAAIGQVADTRGLQAGFAAGLRTGLGFDPFDADALAAAGVDLTRPLAIASHAGVELASLHLATGGAGAAHLTAWLEGIGETAPVAARQGWQLHLVRKGDRAIAGFARHGAQVLTARLADPGGDVLRSLHRAIDAAGGQRSLARAPLFRAVRDGAEAPWYFWTERKDGSVAAGVALEGTRLQLNGRARLPAAGLLGKRAAYPAATASGGLLLARIHFAPAAREEIAGGVAWLLEQACPVCPAAARAADAEEVAGLLAGPAVLGLSHLEPSALRAARLTPAAAPFAWVAQVRDPAAAKRWLARVGDRLGAAAGADMSVTSPLGPLHFGLRGDRLYVASAPTLRDRLLDATTGDAAGPGEALQARLLPARAGEALATLSVTDALRGGPAAALFALRLQLLPLLRASGPLDVRAEPGGKEIYRFGATWELRTTP